MADYFVLLGETRRPYLDPERIAAAFHGLSRTRHPDQRDSREKNAASNDDFTNLNQAQQTLRDPKLRLGYLIGLEFPEVRLSGPSDVPRELATLFGPVHALLGKADALLSRKAAAPSGLARALLAREELAIREEVEALLEALDALYARALEELKDYDSTWQPGEASSQKRLIGFYQRFSYLTRWLDQMRESLFQLGQ